MASSGPHKTGSLMPCPLDRPLKKSKNMKSEAMFLHGKSLLDYYKGDQNAEIILRRDDGFETTIPISIYFRSETDFLPGEIEAINQSAGHILDIGAGSGIHSLLLQSRGLNVTAIDIDNNAVNIMIDKGIKDARCADVMQFEGRPYDTLLMLGHGIGMTENIQGFNLFLDHAVNLIGTKGQILINSVDVRQTDDPVHLKYHQANKRKGRYIGEILLQFEYKGERGPFFGWLHLDPHTLEKLSAMKNWETEILFQEKNGEYLARLTYKKFV
jgi:2-polyprenyl-3-methyl-5-hydroxy-6-metoxy-1,4-benzoquinol methylase